jgi:hypothetical protein
MKKICANPFCTAPAAAPSNHCKVHRVELRAFENHERLRGGWLHLTPPALEEAIFAAKAFRDRGVDESVDLVYEGELIARWEKAPEGNGYVRVAISAKEVFEGANVARLELSGEEVVL